MPCAICKEDGHNRRTCQWAPSIRKNLDKEAKPFCGIKIQPQDEPPICVICLDHVERARTILECGHTYCTTCFSQHIIISNKCPQCRHIIMREELPYVRDFEFIFVYSVDTYITSVRGRPTNLWKQELSGILLLNIVSHLSRVNMRTPPPYDDDGNTSEWLIQLIVEGIELISGPLINEYIISPQQSGDSDDITINSDSYPQLNNMAINGIDLNQLFEAEVNNLVNNNSGGGPAINVDERAMDINFDIS